MQGCSSWKRWHQIFSLSRKIIMKPGYCWQTMGVPIVSKVSRDPHLDPHMTLVKTKAISQLHYAYFPRWQSLHGQKKPQLCRTHFIALGAHWLCFSQGFWVTCNSESRMNQPTLSPKKNKTAITSNFLSFVTKLQKINESVSDIRTVSFFPLSLQAGYTKDLK